MPRACLGGRGWRPLSRGFFFFFFWGGGGRAYIARCVLCVCFGGRAAALARTGRAYTARSAGSGDLAPLSTRPPCVVSVGRPSMACVSSSAYPLAVSTLVGREPELAAVAEFLGASEAEAALAIVGRARDRQDRRLGRGRSPGARARRLCPRRAARGVGGDALVRRPDRPARQSSTPAASKTCRRRSGTRSRSRFSGRPSERPAGRRLVGTALLSLLPGARGRTARRAGRRRRALARLALRRGPRLRNAAARGRKGQGDRLAPLGGRARLARHGRARPAGPAAGARPALGRVAAPRDRRPAPAGTSRGRPWCASRRSRAATRSTRSRSRSCWPRRASRPPAQPLPVPADLQELVVRRVAALPEETRAALVRVAALARPTTELVDVEALAPAEEAGLVRVGLQGRVEFTHPLFASAVYTSAPRALRRETHAALAEAVADPEERAHHLALACDGPDEQVAQALEEASLAARRRGAPDVAAHLTELALKLAPEDDPRRRRAAAGAGRAPPSRGRLPAVGRPARERWSASCRRATSAPARCCCWPRSTSGGRASRRRSASPSRRPARRRSAHCGPAASRSSPCGPARPTCPERPRRPEPHSSCSEERRRRPRAALAGPRRARAGRPLPRQRPRPGGRRARAGGRASPARRRPRSTPGSCSSSGSGCATSTTSTVRGCGSKRPSGRRARRATSRRSPTSCSTARCSSAGPATGRPRSSLQTGRTRPSS